MPRLRKDLDTKEVLSDIKTLYQSGTSAESIAKKHGTSRRAINARLNKMSIPIRGIREANVLFVSQLSPTEKKRKAMAAHDAVRGTKHTEEHRHKISRYNEKNPRMSKYEVALNNELVNRGLTTKPQKSLSRYNIDIAVPEHKVAIEIMGGWHNSPKAIDSFNKKSELLFSLGWFIIVIWPANCFDKTLLSDLVDDICNDRKSGLLAHNAHYVVRGNSNPSIIGHKFLNYITS